MRTGFVVQEGFFGSAVASMLDILVVAEAVRPEIDPSIPPFEVVVAAPQPQVTSSSGMTMIATRSLDELDDLDLIVLPALGTITGPATEAALDTESGQDIVRAIRRVDATRSRLAAACTGVFLLAETGMLDGRMVATSWFLTATFRSRYPEVSIDPERMVVADGPTLTAGAAFAHIDLALAILCDVSPQLTDHVRRLLLIDERPWQSAYASYDLRHNHDAIVTAFEAYVREHLDEPFDTAHVARQIGTNRRTVERHTRQTLDLSPLEIVQRLRVERADYLRRNTNLTTEDIARRVGYTNAETLRALRRRVAPRWWDRRVM